MLNVSINKIFLLDLSATQVDSISNLLLHLLYQNNIVFASHA